MSSRLRRLGLGATRKQTGMVTVRELALELGEATKTVLQWTENGLKHTKRITRYKKEYLLIDWKDFWSWAERNKNMLDLRS